MNDLLAKAELMKVAFEIAKSNHLDGMYIPTSEVLEVYQKLLTEATK